MITKTRNLSKQSEYADIIPFEVVLFLIVKDKICEELSQCRGVNYTIRTVIQVCHGVTNWVTVLFLSPSRYLYDNWQKLLIWNTHENIRLIILFIYLLSFI